MARSAAWTLLLVLAASAQAQPRLVVEPDTVFYTNRGDETSNRVRLISAGTEPVRIDSLRFGDDAYPFSGDNGWGLTIQTPDSIYQLRYGFGVLGNPPFPHIVLPSTDTALVTLNNFDSCLACGVAGKSREVRDVLWVYSNEADGSPDTVRINFALFVSAEPPPRFAHRLALDVYPNPSAAPTLAVTAARGGPHVLVVYDALGRERWRWSGTLRPGERRAVSWAARTAPAGVYLARLMAPSGTATASFTLIG